MNDKKISQIRACLFEAGNILISDEDVNEAFLETGEYTLTSTVDLPNGNRGAIAIKLIDSGVPILKNIRKSSYKLDAPELKIILNKTGMKKEKMDIELPLCAGL